MKCTKQSSLLISALSVLIVVLFFGCSSNSNSSNPNGTGELHAKDFLLPDRVGSQTMFHIVNIVTDTNGVRDSSLRGTISYTTANADYQFTPNLRAILLHVGGTDSAGNKFGNDSMYVFSNEKEIRLSTYFVDSIGRRLIAEPIRAGATFKRTDDTLASSVVTIESVSFPVITALRTFTAVKTMRKLITIIEDTKREILVENYIAPGHFLVKQQTTETVTTLSTGKSSTDITRYDLFFKNF